MFIYSNRAAKGPARPLTFLDIASSCVSAGNPFRRTDAIIASPITSSRDRGGDSNLSHVEMCGSCDVRATIGTESLTGSDKQLAGRRS